MVYFINAERRPGQIKIGTSECLLDRLRALKSLFGNITLILAIDGSYCMESYLHRKFKHICVENEWFYETEELIIAIQRLSVKSLPKVGDTLTWFLQQ